MATIHKIKVLSRTNKFLGCDMKILDKLRQTGRLASVELFDYILSTRVNLSH